MFYFIDCISVLKRHLLRRYTCARTLWCWLHRALFSIELKQRCLCYQVLALFPSSQGLEVTWSSVVKIGQSLYREAPGKDPFRPDQKTPVKNFFLAGSYTKQVTSLPRISHMMPGCNMHITVEHLFRKRKKEKRKTAGTLLQFCRRFLLKRL